MSVLSWGKYKLEIALITAGAAGSYTEFPIIKDGTGTLDSEDGQQLEALGEGGDVVDYKRNANKPTFTCEVFVKKGDTKPIVDADGVIIPNYALRLTPEDDTLEGWIMPKCSVHAKETFSSAEGKKWMYTFKGLKPTTGTMLQSYTKA